MKLHIEEIELLQLAGISQLQWGTYGHHQVTRAYRPRQTSVLCLFRTQWLVGHFLLFARSIFSLIFIPIKILKHKDGVVQTPLSLSISSYFPFTLQGSSHRHEESLLSLWLYFADKLKTSISSIQFSRAACLLRLIILWLFSQPSITFKCLWVRNKICLNHIVSHNFVPAVHSSVRSDMCYNNMFIKETQFSFS